MFLAEMVYDVSANIILDSCVRAVSDWDVITSMIKSWVFGTIISVVRCLPGRPSQPPAWKAVTLAGGGGTTIMRRLPKPLGAIALIMLACAGQACSGAHVTSS